MKNKQRHGCLTAWLIYLMIANSIVSIAFFFNTDKVTEVSPYRPSENIVLLIGSLGILNVFFSFLVLKWVKLGFWGIAVTGLGIFIIQIINGYGIFQPIFGLFGIIVLYAILQLKKNNVSGWENLE